MISALGLRISAVFRRVAPDPFVIAVLLTIVTAALALLFGFRGGDPVAVADRVTRLADSWSTGIWSLLAFSMQMCLILVTGHAVAASPPMRRVIDAAAALPRNAAQASAMVAFAACAFGVLNWGLGLIVGAILAREVGRSLARRGIAAHYPLLAAAGYTGLMVWHGGLSGSAPLTITTWEIAGKVLPASFVAEFAPRAGGGGIGLDRTLGSAMNLFVTGGLLVITPLVFALLTPRKASEMLPIGACTVDAGPVEASDQSEELAGREGALPRWLETSPWIAWGLAAGLIAVLGRFAVLRGGITTITPNEVNAAMLALGLVLHGSARSYIATVEVGARGCAGIILQFPLYGGIMAMMQVSGLVRQMADAFLAWGNATTIPLFSFVSAGIVNLFVPSGGGQWAIQGPIALQAGLDAGIDPAKMVMSVAYGDQLTNMLQPFWALPLLAITGVRARDIVGYTAIAMVIAAAWIGAGLLIF